MRRYRDGYPAFVAVSFLGLVVYLFGAWALWKFDQGKFPLLVEGTEGNGYRLAKIAEERIEPRSWSRWVEATGNGLTFQMDPREAELKSTAEVRFEDGTSQQMVGHGEVIQKRIVAARIWNGASTVVSENFFTWVHLQFTEGDTDQGYRLETVNTLSLAPGQWSDWVARPEGTSSVIVQMDSYSEAVAKCSLRLEDGTVQLVPASERWDSGQAIVGVRLRNEGANAITATVFAWRPMQAAPATTPAAETPATSSSTAETAPAAPVPSATTPKAASDDRASEIRTRLHEGLVSNGYRLETVTTLSLPPREWSDWIVKPSATAGIVEDMDAATEAVVMCALRLEDGHEPVVRASERHLDQAVYAVRLRNDGSQPVSVTVLGWKPLRKLPPAQAHAAQGLTPPENFRIELIRTSQLKPLEWTPWVRRPSGCWGMATAYSDPSYDAEFLGESQLADGSIREVRPGERGAIQQEVVAMRVRNPLADRVLYVHFYTWRKP